MCLLFVFLIFQASSTSELIFQCFGIFSNSTKNSTCSGNGMCIDTNVCECYENFEGFDCSNPILPCHGLMPDHYMACSGFLMGKCLNGTCHCFNGFIGAECETHRSEIILEIMILALCFLCLSGAVMILLTYEMRKGKKNFFYNRTKNLKMTLSEEEEVNVVELEQMEEEKREEEMKFFKINLDF